MSKPLSGTITDYPELVERYPWLRPSVERLEADLAKAESEAKEVHRLRREIASARQVVDETLDAVRDR